jgi:RNA polymerase sigma-B factor
VLDFAPLARRLARRYSTAMLQEDIEQVALLALVKAANRYDPDRDTAFATYAIPTIIGEIKHYLRDHSWDLHVPRRTQELTLRLRRAGGELSAELGRAPTIDELAERMDVSREAALEAIEAAAAREASSLDAPTPLGDGGSVSHPLDQLTHDDGGLQRAMQRADLRRALAVLTTQQRQMVLLRFFADMSQSEIALRIGVTQMQVSRVLRRALSLMREVSPQPD